MIRFQSAQADWPVPNCVRQPAGNPAANAAPESMNRLSPAFRALAAGLFVTLAQLFIAVVLLAPEGPLHYRYQTLVQHDSYWFANIIDRGYDTILPPITRKMMEVSNVAFFPAYPAIAGALRHWVGFATYDALLITAQAAAWGFWTYFFLLCDRWKLSPVVTFFGALSVAAHPTAFFLIAGYSESLFLMALLGFVYWSSAEGRVAKVIAAAHGIVMSATRIVGLPCALYPVVRSLFEGGWARAKDFRGWIRHYAGPIALSAAAMLGGIAFFVYCAVRWGRWDIYMQTQSAGWAIVPDYLAVFKLASYRWGLPPLEDPTRVSQMVMTLGALVFVLVALFEGVAAFRARTGWQARVGLYFAAFTLYFIAVSGVASVQMESMLRYQFCAHALIVLAILHFIAQLRAPRGAIRVAAMAAAALLWPAGFGVQGWYLWTFTRGGWVA
ncbi:MAG: hypothetical protein H0T11_06490 [Chthoniobacterales bacterium]|nr:hypothetical protein [Chthoniobacterales bacterium]